MKCPFFPEFGKWIVAQGCDYLNTEEENNNQHLAKCDNGCGKGGSWCGTMVARSMLVHKIWIGNDY